jgi:hypothetical protein
LNSQETDPKKGSTFTNFYKNKISIKCCKNSDKNVWCDVDDSIAYFIIGSPTVWAFS